MAKVVYTAEATVTGGRAGSRSDDRRRARRPAAPAHRDGGRAAGQTPSSCSRSATRPASRARSASSAGASKAEVGDASIDSKVSLITTEERGFNVAVELDVTLPQVEDPRQAKRIVAAAHEMCPYSNATRGNVEVTLTANGQPVAEASASSALGPAWPAGRISSRAASRSATQLAGRAARAARWRASRARPGGAPGRRGVGRARRLERDDHVLVRAARQRRDRLDGAAVGDPAALQLVVVGRSGRRRAPSPSAPGRRSARPARACRRATVRASS